MFGPPTYSKKTKYPEYINKEEKISAKYHQAAYAYLLMGIVYLIVSYVAMPPHDLGGIMEDFVKENVPTIDDLIVGIGDIEYEDAVNYLAVFAGTLFLGLTYFIYKEYRKLVIVLAVIYLIRFVIAGAALFLDDTFVTVKYVLPLIGLTFYMLVRAAWD